MSENTLEALEARLAAVERLARRQDDVRQITELFQKWHYECTGGFNGIQAGRMEALDVLTDDATIEIQSLHEPGKGPKGREEYTRYWHFYFGDAGPLPYVFQTSFDHRIEVDGDEAVQYCNQLGIFQARDATPMLSLSRRINYLRRTPDGWRIYKTTGDSGFSSPLADLKGPLNALPPQEPRTPWTYGDEPARDPMAPLHEKPRA